MRDRGCRIAGSAAGPVSRWRSQEFSAGAFQVREPVVKGSDKRDRAIEQLLRQRLDSSSDEAADVCLDAETIAAWMDGGLSGAALERAQMHAADCGRCQA